jgi:hypothetical protein
MNYREIQQFRQSWIWIGLTLPGMLIIGLFGFGIKRQVIDGQTFGNNPMSDTGLIVTFACVLLVLLLLVLLFLFARLTTEINHSGIAFRFFPFHFTFRRISWDTVEKYEVITYNPIGDYGGWGIKGNKYGQAYNVSGNLGLKIYLKTGKEILIGTQKKTELTSFLSDLAPLR